jgi:hypothetical protein
MPGKKSAHEIGNAKRNAKTRTRDFFVRNGNHFITTSIVIKSQSQTNINVFFTIEGHVELDYWSFVRIGKAFISS